MRDITAHFHEAVKKEKKYHSDYYDECRRPPQGYWGKEYTASTEPFFMPSPRQFDHEADVPKSLWHNMWHQGEMCCIFGEPNVGKSVLANMIAYDIAASGTSVLYIDFENTPHQALTRYHNPLTECSPTRLPKEINFVTVNPLLSYNTTRNYNLVLDAIEHEFVMEDTPVVVIDDISHICPLRDCAAAQETMRRLRHWTIKYSVSILVVAHAVRHHSSCPLTITSLFGASHTAYCFDSIFAIGRSMRDENTRYVKQLKSRITPIIYGDNNVITLQLVNINNFLCYDIIGAGNIEKDLLQIPQLTDPQALRAEVLRLHLLNWSARQIARRLSLSHTTINSILATIEQSQLALNPPTTPEATPITMASVETAEPSQRRARGSEQRVVGCKPVPQSANLPQRVETVETAESVENTETLATEPQASFFSPQIASLARKTGLPSVPQLLLDPTLPFVERKPGDDPDINQVSLYYRHNPLCSMLDTLHCNFLYSSIWSNSLHVKEWLEPTDDNDKGYYNHPGTLIYSTTHHCLARVCQSHIDTLSSEFPAGTTPHQVEQQLTQAVTCLRNKLIQAQPTGRELNPKLLTAQDLAEAAAISNLPEELIIDVFLPNDPPPRQ